MSDTSAYISAQRAEQDRAEARQANLDRAARTIWETPDGKLPPLPLIQTIGSHDLAHFRDNGSRFFREIASRLLLTEASTVLDLGCGCGRMAIPFVNFLTEGRFYGCDVWPEGIAWCEENLTSRGNASFHLQPAANNYYFTDFEASKKNDFKLEWLEDGVLDASYAISVFTHLIREDAQSYLSEIARGTKVGGLGYFTFFVIDKYFAAYRDRTGNHAALSESKTDPGCFYAYSGQDFFGGFTMDALQEMLAEAGWAIIGFELGSWAAKPGAINYQDTFIVERRA
ncbi:MAG: class I SAM-dependent methyltransferase [Phenylobacterium sp.]